MDPDRVSIHLQPWINWCDVNIISTSTISISTSSSTILYHIVKSRNYRVRKWETKIDTVISRTIMSRTIMSRTMIIYNWDLNTKIIIKQQPTIINTSTINNQLSIENQHTHFCHSQKCSTTNSHSYDTVQFYYIKAETHNKIQYNTIIQ